MNTHKITLIIGIIMASAAMIAYPVDHRKEASYADKANESNDIIAYNIF